MDGTSFAYTFADAAGRRAPHRPVLRDVRQPRHLPGRLVGVHQARQGALGLLAGDAGALRARQRLGPRQDAWELYYLPDDFSQAHDIAAEHPEKLAELQELFWAEAERNRALPLLGGLAAFFGILPPMPTKTRFTFAGDVQNIQTAMLPRIYGRSYAIEAEVHIPEGGAEGVLCAFADFIGGFALWVDENGHLHHTYQFLGVDTYKQTSTEPVPTGDVTLKMLFDADEPQPGHRRRRHAAGRTTARSARVASRARSR